MIDKITMDHYATTSDPRMMFDVISKLNQIIDHLNSMIHEPCPECHDQKTVTIIDGIGMFKESDCPRCNKEKQDDT